MIFICDVQATPSAFIAIRLPQPNSALRTIRRMTAGNLSAPDKLRCTDSRGVHLPFILPARFSEFPRRELGLRPTYKRIVSVRIRTYG